MRLRAVIAPLVVLGLSVALGSGQQLRVRGRGLPAGSAKARGDLYVVLNIEVPGHVTDEERALWEELKRRSKFNPRET